MLHKARLPLIVVVSFMLFVAAACGQKPGVADQPTGFSLGSGELPEGFEIVDGQVVNTETGEVLGSAEDILGGGGGGGGGDTTTGGGDSEGPGAGPDDGGDPGPAGPGDATGVSGDTIKIGIHAPITGAAPVPSASFQRGKDLYWDWRRNNKNPMHGRHVQVVFRNDNYNPSQAVSACREMVEQEKVFLLVGVAGTDQIQACARYAASVGVPYLSGGVTEIGLAGLRNYFALWMSYKQQGPLLADMVVKKLGGRSKKNGMLRFNTPTFQDAHDAFIKGMNDRGAKVEYDRAISKTAGTSEAQTVATEMSQQGVENIYVLTSPTFFIQLAQAASRQNYFPMYNGVGLSMGIDTVANVACSNNNSIRNAKFLNPFPSFADSNRFDPDFRRAGGTDDIMFGLWATSKLLAAMFEKVGRGLTREAFVSSTEQGTFKTGVHPDVRYTPDNHFGGTAMHQIKSDCSNRRWVTEQAFVRGF